MRITLPEHASVIGRWVHPVAALEAAEKLRSACQDLEPTFDRVHHRGGPMFLNLSMAREAVGNIAEGEKWRIGPNVGPLLAAVLDGEEPSSWGARDCHTKSGKVYRRAFESDYTVYELLPGLAERAGVAN